MYRYSVNFITQTFDELIKIKSDELERMIINYILELKKRVKISQVSQKEARPQFGV